MISATARSALTLLLSIALSIMPACTAESRDLESEPEPSGVVPEGWMTFSLDSDAFSFSYSPEWHTEQYSNVSSFSTLLTYVANQELHDPCKTSHPSPGTTQVQCGRPLRTLAPGGVLVGWYSKGFPGQTLSDRPGSEIMVGGHEARLAIREDDCGMRADLEIVASIDRGNGGNWYEFRACLRGPGLSDLKSAAIASLRSLRFEEPDVSS